MWGTLEHRRARRLASHCSACAAELNAVIKWRLKLRMERVRANKIREFVIRTWRHRRTPGIGECLDEARTVLEVRMAGTRVG